MNKMSLTKPIKESKFRETIRKLENKSSGTD